MYQLFFLVLFLKEQNVESHDLKSFLIIFVFLFLYIGK